MPRRSPPLVLASASPRRRALLSGAGVPHRVEPAELCEQRRASEPPEQFATRLAHAKARQVAQRLGPEPPRLVLGADTIVVLGAEVIGKPADPEDAVACLCRLVGRVHRVLTAVALVETATGRERHALVESRVRMRPASREELEAYVATGEPLDKAGAYALQGRGSALVEAVEGSESNVIGLPLEETLALLREAGGAELP